MCSDKIGKEMKISKCSENENNVHENNLKPTTHHFAKNVLASLAVRKGQRN